MPNFEQKNVLRDEKRKFLKNKWMLSHFDLCKYVKSKKFTEKNMI